MSITAATDGIAPATYLVDSSGNPLSSSNGQPISVAQIAGTATATGNGTTNAGTMRVTVSSDSTGQLAIADGTTPTQKLAVDSAGNASMNLGKIGGIASQMAG